MVLARNPEEMATAQSQLVAWATRKVLNEEAQLEEALVNLEHVSALRRAIRSHDHARIREYASKCTEGLLSRELSYIAWQGRVDTLELLVDELGADIHFREEEPLRRVCEGAENKSHTLPVVDFFVSRGADMMARDSTPLFNAAENGFYDVVLYLWQCGARPTEANPALTIAALKGHLQVARFFVSKGVDKSHAVTALAAKTHQMDGYFGLPDHMRLVYDYLIGYTRKTVWEYLQDDD